MDQVLKQALAGPLPEAPPPAPEEALDRGEGLSTRH